MVQDLSKRLQEEAKSYPLGHTPLKKRTKLNMKSLALEAGFKLTMVELNEDLGTTDSLVSSSLRNESKALAANFSTIWQLVEGAWDATKHLHLEGVSKKSVCVPSLEPLLLNSCGFID